MSFLFKKIKEQYNKKLPFVCYCKPNSDKIIAFFQKNDKLFELDNENSGFAFVSFDNQKRYLIPENNSDIYIEKFSNSDFIYEIAVNTNENSETNAPKKQKIITYENNKSEINYSEKDNFENLVQKGVKAIEDGTFEKVVLSRKETIKIDKFDLELVFKKLMFNYKNAFKYCFYHPKIGQWIGATPEQFLKIEKNSVNTVSLAGTQKYQKNVEVTWQNKEIDEQQIVTNFIVDNLKLFSNDVKHSKPYNQNAGSLVHIKTDISAKIEDVRVISEIIESLHPTPAVCGFPKAVAKQFIIKNEGYKREFYTGYIGEWNKNFDKFDDGQSDLFVNLRCMKIERNELNLYIGCGITKNSIAENEFFETVHKSMIMKNIL